MPGHGLKPLKQPRPKHTEAGVDIEQRAVGRTDDAVRFGIGVLVAPVRFGLAVKWAVVCVNMRGNGMASCERAGLAVSRWIEAA